MMDTQLPQTLEASESQFKGHLERRVGNENARSKQGSILYIRGAIKNLKLSERFISAGNTWTAERAQQRRADTGAEGMEALASLFIRELGRDSVALGEAGRAKKNEEM